MGLARSRCVNAPGTLVRDTGLFEGGVGSRFLGRCYFDLVHRKRPGASQHVLVRLNASFRFQTSKLDYFGPLLCFCDDEVSEVGWGACNDGATQVVQPPLYHGID